MSASTNEGGNEYGLGEAAFATSECMRWEWAAIENSNEVGFGFGVLDMGKRKVPDTNLIQREGKVGMGKLGQETDFHFGWLGIRYIVSGQCWFRALVGAETDRTFRLQDSYHELKEQQCS